MHSEASSEVFPFHGVTEEEGFSQCPVRGRGSSIVSVSFGNLMTHINIDE